MSSLLRSIHSVSKVPTIRLVSASYSAQAGVKEQIEKLVKDKKIVVFMKGTPDAPRCGFSNAVVQILKFHGVDQYNAHDVLADEALRQGIILYLLKVGIISIRLSNWHHLKICSKRSAARAPNDRSVGPLSCSYIRKFSYP